MQCVTPVEVVFIPRHDLLAAIARSPSLRGRLLRVIRKQQARRIAALMKKVLGRDRVEDIIQFEKEMYCFEMEMMLTGFI